MMRKKVLAGVFATVFAGLVLAAWYPVIEGDPTPGPIPDDSRTATRDEPASLEQRVAALEEALVIERDARQLLQEELLYLSGSVSGEAALAADRADAMPVGSTSIEQPVQSSGRISRRSGSRDPEARKARLVENGFSLPEAEQILRRESELQMASLQARYEARLNGERVNIPSSAVTLREELGDDAYGRYLEANGRSTSVTVSSIFEGSPALNAGLRPGDEIVRYDGNRVFSMNDISQYVLDGAPGENVTIEVTRDGMVMQLAIPRGPLGVSGGRRTAR